MAIALGRSRMRSLSFSLFVRGLCSSSSDMKMGHIPVMANEVVEYLQPKPEQLLVDMTFGSGGHSRHILDCCPTVRLVVLDRDPVAHALATCLADQYPGRVVPLLGRFSELPRLLGTCGIRQGSVDAFLFDLGCSSMQFDVPERGFSISKDGPLDMRMDGDRFPDMPTAADVLARADEIDLAKIFKIYGEEKQAKKIARAIIEARYTFKRLETTTELADLVASVCCDERRLDSLQRFSHAATKTFQALRIFVNNEVNEINYAMLVAQAYLRAGGRLATLAFHSLEDRIVKRHLLGNIVDNAINPLPLKYSSHSFCHDRESAESLVESNWELLHKHVMTPQAVEVEENPRSRSAKLRVAVKIK